MWEMECGQRVNWVLDSLANVWWCVEAQNRLLFRLFNRSRDGLLICVTSFLKIWDLCLRAFWMGFWGVEAKRIKVTRLSSMTLISCRNIQTKHKYKYGVENNINERKLRKTYRDFTWFDTMAYVHRIKPYRLYFYYFTVCYDMLCEVLFIRQQ